jgi:hypothetical protein
MTYTDNNLSVIRYSIFDSYDALQPITSKPDVVVVEAIDDGSMVYIDCLAMNGSVGSQELRQDPVREPRNFLNAIRYRLVGIVLIFRIGTYR